MRRRNYLMIGGNEPNTADWISAFRVTPKVIEVIAKDWKRQFPYVSYMAVNLKHSKIHYQSEEEK